MPLTNADRDQKFRDCPSYARYVLEDDANIALSDGKTVTLKASSQNVTLLCIGIDKDNKAIVFMYNTVEENKDAAKALSEYSEEKGLTVEALKKMNLKVDQLYRGQAPEGIAPTTGFKDMRDPKLTPGPKGKGASADWPPHEMGGLAAPAFGVALPRAAATKIFPA